MRLFCPILFAALLVPSLFAGCNDKKTPADDSSEQRLPAPAMGAKQTGKPPVKMPPVPPPPPPKK